MGEGSSSRFLAGLTLLFAGSDAELLAFRLETKSVHMYGYVRLVGLKGSCLPGLSIRCFFQGL